MAIGNQLVFDINGNVEDFIFILSTKDYRHLGALQNVVSDTVHNSENLSLFNTISFEIYKTVEKEIENENVDIQEPLWDEIDNLKLIYVRELDEYFEIEVQLDDTTDIIKKTIKGTSLCESELGQTKIHGLEANTETDISRDDYESTIFYNPKNPSVSLLNRALSEAPHYTIMHVDKSLWNLQRTFSVDDISIYDWLMGDCANEFNCLFQFDTTTRGVYVYDLYTVCKDCGYRGDYIDECPECGSVDLDYFGDDTTIYIDKENLTDAIQFTTDVGSIKNCFKLVAGDDVITAMIKLINPYGSNFIYKPTDSQLAEMPEELRNKIISHNELYVSKKDEYEGIIANILEASSKIDYYTHTMMPTIENAEVTAQTEADKLTAMNLSPLGLSSVTISTSKATVESALKNYARVFVKTGYVKLDINQSNYKYVGIGADGWNHGTWTGNFKVTNYSDEEDVAYSNVITVDVYDNYQDFVEQKIMKNIATNSNEEDSVFDVLSISELDDLKDALELYCLKRLESFYDAIQSALDVLLEADQASESADLYDVLYLPYYEKLQACQSELDARQITIDEWQNTYDNLLLQKEEIQAELNFEDYLGTDLYKVFCMYRREDTYQNNNYISTGLSNPEIIQKAKDFIEVAEKELEKARTPKHSITSTLYNLLIIPEFKPIIDHFKLGNWLRICVDGELYRLRLIGYKLSFSSIQTLEVTFSNVTKMNSVTDNRDEMFDLINSMATTYDYYAKQAQNGDEASVEISRWLENGLNNALYNLKNNNNEEIVFDKHGLWARTYNSETGNYDPEMLRITHNILAYSDDGFKTVRTALGKHNYYKFDETGKLVQDTAYGLSCDFVTSGTVYGSQIISGDIYSENYKLDSLGNVIQGSHLALKTGGFSLASGKLTYDPVSNDLICKGLTIYWDTSTTPEISDISGLNDYLEQLDGRIQTYSQAIDPSSNWTATEKAQNVGDLWFDTANSLTKRWNGSSWDVVTDSELEELAKSKAQIFTSTPVPPYYVGDLWVQGSSGDIMNCIKARTSGNYTASDWAKSSKYTDDTVAKEALEAARQGLEDAAKGIDLANAAQESATNAEKNAKDYADTQDKSLSESLTSAYEKYTDSEIATFDSYVAKYLGLGGSTIIGSNYIVSPLIEGGYLNITNTSNNSRVIIDPNNLTKNGYIFQVHNGTQVSVGIKSNGDAIFSGDIVAKSLTLGSGVSISTNDISGLSKVATSGKYGDLSDTPTIPTSVEDLGINSSTIVYKGDITQSTEQDSNGISYLKTTVPTTNGSITYSTYDADNYIVFGRSKGTNSEGKNYVCISKDGLLTARNALIYGTVYATDGEFTGKITSGTGNIAGWTISSSRLYKENTSSGLYVALCAPTQIGTAGNGNADVLVCRTGTSSSGYSYPLILSSDGTLSASKLNITGGSININNGTFSVNSSGYLTAVNLKAEKIQSDGNVTFNATDIYNGGIYTNANMFAERNISCNINMYAGGDLTVKGNASVHGTFWAASGTIDSSDRNVKNSIETLDYDKTTKFIYSLTPRKYRYNAGTSNRFHHGLIAQELNESMYEDWGVYVDNTDAENGHMGIRYQELIADLIAVVQTQNKRIQKLESLIQTTT